MNRTATAGTARTKALTTHHGEFGSRRILPRKPMTAAPRLPRAPARAIETATSPRLRHPRRSTGVAATARKRTGMNAGRARKRTIRFMLYCQQFYRVSSGSFGEKIEYLKWSLSGGGSGDVESLFAGPFGAPPARTPPNFQSGRRRRTKPSAYLHPASLPTAWARSAILFRIASTSVTCDWWRERALILRSNVSVTST